MPETKRDLALIIEETLVQRYEGVKNEDGVWITPAFPKLIYVLEEDNVRPGTPYYYLTRLAAKCTARRHGAGLHLREDHDAGQGDRTGRASATPAWAAAPSSPPTWIRRPGSPSTTAGSTRAWSPSTCRMWPSPPAAIWSKFWKIFEERLELCYRALRCAATSRLKGTLSDAAPILWQYGALARLKKGEPIDKLLYNGYSTISLGYAGLYECVKYMTGKSHTDPDATPFALEVMQHMNRASRQQWKAKEHIDFSLYGTPLESTTYKFAKCLQKRFGVIAGITDKGYITNSYHVHVTEEIDAFSKLSLRGPVPGTSPPAAPSAMWRCPTCSRTWRPCSRSWASSTTTSCTPS